MSDLVDMLYSQNLGIPFENDKVPCLLYADDTCLLADSEENLQQMLNVSDAFASKWNMTFNNEKSKVMVIGKRINYDKKWNLGNFYITECKSYKYLGIVFSQSLNDSHHIKTHLKDKAGRLRAYMCSILSSHDNINRVNFGNNIWKNVILPSISHGCSFWLKTLRKLVTS